MDLTETDIDEAMIERLVRGFYANARKDPLIGPIFEARVADWESHLSEISAFWSSLILRTGRYQGRPMAKHLPLPVDAQHFDRWLMLFEEAARSLCPPQAAAYFIDRARRIAQSFELGVAGAHGVLLRSGERYRQVS
jgi:hemoglobin